MLTPYPGNSGRNHLLKRTSITMDQELYTNLLSYHLNAEHPPHLFRYSDKRTILRRVVALPDHVRILHALHDQDAQFGLAAHVNVLVNRSLTRSSNLRLLLEIVISSLRLTSSRKLPSLRLYQTRRQKRVITDNGAAFIGPDFTDLCNLLNIRHAFSSAWHPQSKIIQTTGTPSSPSPNSPTIRNPTNLSNRRSPLYQSSLTMPTRMNTSATNNSSASPLTALLRYITSPPLFRRSEGPPASHG